MTSNTATKITTNAASIYEVSTYGFAGHYGKQIVIGKDGMTHAAVVVNEHNEITITLHVNEKAAQAGLRRLLASFDRQSLGASGTTLPAYEINEIN